MYWPILFLKSIAIGILVAMPLGPICMLLIKKTLESGLAAGAAIAIGAACGDAFYSGLAGAAMASVASFIAQYKYPLRIAGKFVMGAVFASELYHWSSPKESVKLSIADTFTLGMQIFLMTLANPTTILVISSVFLSTGIQFTGLPEITIATIGIFLGSTTWCMMLAHITMYAQKNLPVWFVDALKSLSLLILAGFVVFM